MTVIPPFDHPHDMAGQGTVAKELFESVGELDMVVTPVGGGGLLSGCAIATRHLHPHCEIVGVEPESGNDAQRSLAEGRIVRIETPRTIADAAQSRTLGQHTFPVLRELGARIVTVSDAELVETMKLIASRMKLVVEPTGCSWPPRHCSRGSSISQASALAWCFREGTWTWRGLPSSSVDRLAAGQLLARLRPLLLLDQAPHTLLPFSTIKGR